jgi:hypothetical protein
MEVVQADDQGGYIGFEWENRWSLYVIAEYMEKKHKTVLLANFKKILGWRGLQQ